MASLLRIGPTREPNRQISGFQELRSIGYTLSRSHCKSNQKSKDVKRARACYIGPSVVINGPFYRGSSRLGSALHSEGPESDTKRAALTVVTLAQCTLNATFHSCPAEARNSCDEASCRNFKLWLVSAQQAHKIDYISHLFYPPEVGSPTSYIPW